ncbi:hypothetical protein DFH09DRAFT_1359374 [Mycena vulgaris]|nr:hypothetical protein DFH09DRAFT_1359374 [Mycena vulgaris]
MLGPRSIDSRLQHQRSTKLLISRFESLSDKKPAEGAAIYPARTPLFPPKQPLNSKKDKSPIRQSFRNLLAVFKKGSGLRGGRKPDLKCVQIPSPDIIPSPDDPFTVSTKSFTGPQLAGSIFYLARSPETPPTPPPVHPVWTFCSAFLEGDTVHLTWPATPSTHSILLKHCTDVRSLTSHQLDPEEKALLPGDATDLKVFEILFDGRAGEKFATTSVRERARWISAIWDVILPSADAPSTQPDLVDGTQDISSSARPSTICSRSLNRALPPVPEQLYCPIAPARSPSPRMLVSPSIYPPARTDSRGASSICSRSKSPSIANLSQLSVVKQRLAQIERNQQPQSAPTSPAPLSRNSSVMRTRSLRVQILPHDNATVIATSPASPTSILESYGEPSSAVSSGISPVFDNVLDGHVKRNHPGGQETSLAYQMHKLPDTHPPSTDVHLDLLTDIHHMISGVARRNEDTDNTLDIIQNQLSLPKILQYDLAAITQSLGDIDERLRSDLPSIIKLVAEVQAGRDTESKIPSESGEKPSMEMPTTCNLDKLDQILELLKEDSSQRSLQTLQQADSVRYLNELNSASLEIYPKWLEAFVSGGTAQIQVVAAGVEKLCQELGFFEENNLSGGTNVTAAIRQFAMDGHARDQSAAALQLSVNNLAALIASESRNSFASLIDQQRQDQEGLLRALTAELSNEIRGERLRFVDAMKEATAINVKMHVEQLKTELAREVRADLFAFYSKQKPPQGVPPSRPMYAPQSRMTPGPRVLPNPRYAVYP